MTINTHNSIQADITLYNIILKLISVYTIPLDDIGVNIDVDIDRVGGIEVVVDSLSVGVDTTLLVELVTPGVTDNNVNSNNEIHYHSVHACLTRYCLGDCTNNSGSGYINCLNTFSCEGWCHLRCEHRGWDHYIAIDDTGVNHGATGGWWTICGQSVVNVLYVVNCVSCESVDTSRGQIVIGTIRIT